MDTKFSVAIHILVMLSESKKRLSSQDLARSVNSQSSYIRKVLALLKKAGILTSSQGKVGYDFQKSPKEISLLDIYLACQETERVKFVEIHKDTNQECPVGKHIESVLTPTFESIENEIAKSLEGRTLEEVINNLYKSAGVK